MLKAWDIAKTKLGGNANTLHQNAQMLTLNGLSDPTYRFAAHHSGGHSVGMAIDLGIGMQWVLGRNMTTQDQSGTGNNPTIDLTTVAGSGWSVERARLLSEMLPETPVANVMNNQRQALRDFLAIYALTQNDGDASNNNGTWEELDVKNVGARAALFGSGDQSGGLISRVLIGGDTVGNPFDNIRSVLSALDITANKKDAHHNHFHIFMRAPTRVDITQNLLAENNGLEQTASEMSDAMRIAAQMLIEDMQSRLNLNQGDINMLFMDVPPDVPAQYAPVMLAQASQAQDNAGTDRTIGVCHLVNSLGVAGRDTPLSPVYVISPAATVSDYINMVEKRKVGLEGKATLLKGPEHGVLKEVPELSSWGQNYRYTPVENYIGTDQVTFLIEIGGIKVKAVYHFKVIDGGAIGGTELFDKKNCPKGMFWKISTTQAPNGSLVINTIGYLPPVAATSTSVTDANALTSWFTLAQLDGKVADMSGVNITFADLPGSAVGQTVGSNITLDTNAAGHGWYVDANPWDNSEYLATSNPYEWVARAGSAAEGKMDLLSVLLHEYGHALGIEHSMDSHDYMATTLTPGVRRLPSAEELALMQRLVGQVKEGMVADSTLSPTLPLQGGGEQDAPNPALPLSGGFLAFLGRRKESGFGVQDVFNPQPPAIRPQYAVAANAAFTGLDSPMGWNTLGSVGITNNAATLNEVSATHTRLSQVFTVNAKDRYLTFTLSGAALDDLTGAPDDAFEAALLDASTGLSLLGGIGLTRSDAFLNLQADGAQNLANCVTCSDNPDGSRTYRVDLSGITAGTVANLSFDLIGFGQNNSRLTLSDVRVSGLPQLQDEAATMLEDGSLAFDPYAQADAQLRPMLAANVVDAPLHGAITVNGDGTFSYTPDLDYAGSDSFTYRLSDGPLESNLATVSITLTAVNDAPVAADVQLVTNEDTALTITLGAYASDVDSATLTPVIVTGPAHGTLTQNADGSFTYTPDANYNGTDSFTYMVNDGALDSNVATVSLAIASVNDAPQGADNTIATPEDTAYTFTVADFGFSDAADGNNLAAVHIMDIPLAGSLMLNGAAVTAGQAIGMADIAAGLLVFEESQKSKGQTQIFPGQ